jgi:spoIIIJ-associated protein
MLSEDQQKSIQATIEEFFKKMTSGVDFVGITISSRDSHKAADIQKEPESVVEATVTLFEPQMFIGQNGQTLFEIERILRMILSKQYSQSIILALDINEYKKRKEEHLRTLARDIANEVAFMKEKKTLPPMPAFQRRIIHMELAQRQDVATESQGEGEHRCVVIVPK